MLRGEVAQFRLGGLPAHAGEPSRWVVRQMPLADATGGLVQDETERFLHIGARDQWQRFVQRVTEPGIDVPDPRRVLTCR